MKKAQILSAIALAFALGVTPVIATANTVSAFTVEDTDKDVEGKATLADVNNAVAAVKANVTYKNMVALNTVLEDYEDGEYADLDGQEFPGIKSALTAIQTGVGGTALTNNTKFFDDLAKDYDDEKINSSEALTQAVAQAKKVKNYNTIAAVFAAETAGTNDTLDSAAYLRAVRALNGVLSSNGIDVIVISDNQVVDEDFQDTVEAQITKLVAKGNTGTPTVTAEMYEKLYNAIKTAEENNEKYTKGLAAFETALNASGVLTNDGLVALKTELKEQDITLAALNTIATTQNNNLSNWDNVEAAVKDAEKKAIDLDAPQNYDLVIALASAYATATNNGTQTVEEIAQTLVGYKAPAEQNTISEGPVTVTGAFPADYKLSVVKSDKKIAAFGDAKYAMWDINIVDQNNNKVNVEGSVMVTINVPEGFDAAKSSVYFVTAEGKVEKLAARVENGKMVFTTSHFSLYAIVEDNGKNFGIGAPDTGIVAGTENSASTTVAMVAGVATALTAAGAGVVAYRNARRSTRK